VQISRTIRTQSLGEQAIESNVAQQNQSRFRLEQAGIGPFGLISRKETDALYFEAIRFNPRLALDFVARRGPMSQISVRAAALSATHLLVQKAALELDVAPDEFEALEPRVRYGRPILQVADSLINGSGLCRRLADARSTGQPEIVYLAEQILLNPDAWPLRDFLAPEHRHTCATSCYRCIQQYQNRRFHSLLDWRLGLAFIRAMLDERFSCGIDGRFDGYPELADWSVRAQALAANAAAMRPRSLRAEVAGPRSLPLITHVGADGRTTHQTVVVHPLWRLDAGATRQLSEGLQRIATHFVDTFELERRPLRALERAADRLPAPEFQNA
jgi:hypothetical protein